MRICMKPTGGTLRHVERNAGIIGSRGVIIRSSMYLFLAILLCLVTIGCGARSSAGSLKHYDPSGRPTYRILLPRDLAEVSGLAYTPDGRLLAHGDEEAVVYQIDLAQGRPVKRFGIGGQEGPLRGDFEDIAVIGDRIFLVTSSGELVEGREGADGETTAAVRRGRGLGGACEVEGLTPDQGSGSLLMLCKRTKGTRWRGQVVVLAISPETFEFEPEPRLLIPENALRRATGARGFLGSAIVQQPQRGAFILLAGPQHAYAEVDSTGKVLAGGVLRAGRHRQPEGLAIAPDRTLVIGDEAAGKTATITGYGYRR
jgi:hypothetical protein